MEKSEKAKAGKAKLTDFVKLIDKELTNYFKGELKNIFGVSKKEKDLDKNILEHIMEHDLRPAKRLRGSFIYYGYRLFKDDKESEIRKAAMSIELIHTALLMHDDFMDQDDIRRGGPTTQYFFGKDDLHYGESMAVNVGDAVLELGQELLLSANFEAELVKKATIKMLRGITNTAWGQAYDVSLEKMRGEWTEDDVITVHKAKTAIYTYENPLFIGAILAGLEGEVFEILHDYSMDGGVAFQLQDDILGVFGDPEKTGKSANSDLLQGKCTLLAMKTLLEGSEQQKRDLEKVWGKRIADDVAIRAAKQALIDSGSLEYNRTISRVYAQKAVESAEKLRTLQLSSEAIDFIQGIAQYMVNREV